MPYFEWSLNRKPVSKPAHNTSQSWKGTSNKLVTQKPNVLNAYSCQIFGVVSKYKTQSNSSSINSNFKTKSFSCWSLTGLSLDISRIAASAFVFKVTTRGLEYGLGVKQTVGLKPSASIYGISILGATRQISQGCLYYERRAEPHSQSQWEPNGAVSLQDLCQRSAAFFKNIQLYTVCVPVPEQ